MKRVSCIQPEAADQGFEKEGYELGQRIGKMQILVPLIKRKFGSISITVLNRLYQLSAEQLDELGEALFDFASTADLENWLSRH